MGVAGFVSNVNKHFHYGQPAAKFVKNQNLEMKVFNSFLKLLQDHFLPIPITTMYFVRHF